MFSKFKLALFVAAAMVLNVASATEYARLNDGEIMQKGDSLKDPTFNYVLHMQYDGNLVIYDQRTGSLRWARFGFIPGRLRKPKQKWLRKLPNGTEFFKWEF